MLLFLSETNSDIRLGELGEIEIHCFCVWETSDDMRLGELEGVEIYCFCLSWRRMMTCALVSLRKLRFIAFVFGDEGCQRARLQNDDDIVARLDGAWTGVY